MSRQVSMQFGKPIVGVNQGESTGSGAGVTLLWTNSDPASTFAAQKISLNLAEYEWVKIEAILADSDILSYAIIMDAPVGTEDDHQKCMIQFHNRHLVTEASGAVYLYTRAFYAVETGVTFTDCSRRTLTINGDAANSTQNARAVPTRIWGIKYG